MTNTNLQLANGLRALFVPREHLAQAYVALYVGVGSRHEEEKNNGITHVLEHMLFRGTHSFVDATALNAAAENFGGYLEGATYRDHLMFATSCHPAAIPDAILILGELVQTPRYRALEIERHILHEEILETLDRDGRMIDLDNITHQAVFGKHSLAWPIEGKIETIKQFTKQDLDLHRERFIVGNNAVLCIAGALDRTKTENAIKRAFAKLPAGSRPACESPPVPQKTPVLRYVKNASSQVDLRVTFRGTPIRSPNYPALVLLARLLADGLASRMHAELVDRRGLAYSLHAGLTTYADTGLFDFEISVAPDKAAEAVAALLQFAKGSGRFRFQPHELVRSRRRFRYSMEFMNDDAADLASWFGRSALFGVEHEMAALEGRLKKLSPTDLHHAAQHFFQKQGLVIAAVGELAKGEYSRIRRVIENWQ